jgi:GNAT superfamily N-acetyltransferase
MGSQVHVRVAEPDDLAWIAKHDGHLDAPALALKVAAKEVVVAETAGERVGLLRLDHLWSSVPFVAQVRVAEASRRRGVGAALVAFVADRSRAQGAAMLLSSVTAGEPAPLAWHLAVGFAECGRLSGLNGDGADEIVLRMALAAV